MISYRAYPAIFAMAIFIATFSASIILSHLWPTTCWLPRIGGLLVGIAVFIQGYVSVNNELFSVAWRWGLTREQAYMHFANLSAFFGTIVWAFGDLLPSVLWSSNSICLAQ